LIGNKAPLPIFATLKIDMNEPFILPLTYQNRELEFQARFERYGYTHRIAVLIDELTVSFEPDEEGGYRALGSPGHIQAGLLLALAEKLATLSV
jgi:hypothetical protein